MRPNIVAVTRSNTASQFDPYGHRGTRTHGATGICRGIHLNLIPGIALGIGLGIERGVQRDRLPGD